LFVIIIVPCLSSIMGGIVSSFVCEMVGLAYPTWASFKALETTDKDDDTQWLTYWVIYAFFRVIEIFADVFVSWFPFYYTFKLFLLILLQLPQLQLPKYIYTVHVRPLLKTKEKDLDKMLENTINSVRGTAVNVIKDGASVLTQRYTEQVTADLAPAKHG